MISYIHVEHQFGFYPSETIQVKQVHESYCLGYRIMMGSYLVNMGVFKASAFSKYMLNVSDSVVRILTIKMK